ncbi:MULTISPECIES: hypothetical protein [Providencia]|uniref:hypothetical protein n=1 Tax=Providencia TaxID=586 RepID=UPI002348F83A|nr:MULTISPECIES: hypothetical protein [Providencia]MDH2364854.1 hypothetical protein [Providencia rettgeri]HEM7186668.1 hypothetical protein [Providencia rettgeri]
MFYKLSNIGYLLSADTSHEISVQLQGSDNSTYNFTLKLGDRDINQMTIKEINDLAIQHLKNNVIKCP